MGCIQTVLVFDECWEELTSHSAIKLSENIEVDVENLKRLQEMVAYLFECKYRLLISPTLVMCPRVWVSKQMVCLNVRNLCNTSLFPVTKHYV